MVSEQQLRERVKELKARKKQADSFKKLKTEERTLTREFRSKGKLRTFGRGVTRGLKSVGRVPKPFKVKKVKKVKKRAKVSIIIKKPIKQQVQSEPRLPLSQREQQIIRQQFKAQKDKATLNFLMNV